MMRRILSAALIATALLGAGCRRAVPVVTPAATPQAPHADPLADDLDAAVDDLKAVE